MNTNNTLGDNLIELKNVCKNYKDFSLNCSLEIKRGTVTGLIGKNGAGKTTVFKALLGLIRIDSGSIFYKGEERNSLGATDREHIGVVLAESFISAYLNAKDVCDVLAKAYSTFDRQKFETYCRRFDIPMKKRIKEFSTGMKAKLKLISALCHETELLVLDEPTAGLDPRGRDRILGMIRDLHAEGGVTVIMVSHSMDDVARLATRLVVMSRGQLVATGTPREIFRQREMMERIGLGVPEAAQLCGKLRARGLPLPEDLYTPEELRDALLALWKEAPQA